VETSQTLVQPRLAGPRTGGDEGQLLLGRYRLLERLGAGGFGVVWRAQDEQLHREVALKRIPLPAPEDRERATREALANARLSHPAIVALYEACSDDSAFYLVSELVHGETLAELIGAADLPDEQIREVGVAVAEALAHAHSRGVIHRDVKPQNVLVVAEPRERLGVAKLADFGGAQLAGEETLTRPGDVLGTLAYMAPEQSDGHTVGEAADVYALALVLYEAFSGVQPVRGATPAATARRIGRPIESLRRHRGDLPRALTDAIDAALHPDPERRATLEELRDALGERLGGPALGGWEPDLERPAGPQLAPALRAHGAGQDEQEPERRRRAVAVVPRGGWLALAVAVAVWQAALGRFGVALLALAAASPLLALPRRAGPGWLAAGLAPALGLAGLAGAYPALAGQAARWRERAGLGALGFWWLTLAEPLLGRRLWRGPLQGTPPRAAWEGSLQHAMADVLGPLFTAQLLVGTALWAAAAAALPWVVRGRSAALDVAGAVTWTVALLAGAPLLERGLLGASTGPDPRGALLGATLGCVLAVGARALRGPV
jgi:eukaryotic-like serine/threonine-protein kinase